MRAWICAALGLALSACESVPDVQFNDGDASTASPDGASAVVDGSDAALEDGATNDVVTEIDAGDAAMSYCPNPPPPYTCCNSGVLCRGQPNKCTQGACDVTCKDCVHVCCLRNNGDLIQCANNLGECPPP